MAHPPDPRVDELREQLKALGYLDARVDRFVLGGGAPPGRAAALAAGIDKCARIGWNTEDLRGRAEGFYFKRFIDRFRALLAERVPGRGTSGLGERSV